MSRTIQEITGKHADIIVFRTIRTIAAKKDHGADQSTWPRLVALASGLPQAQRWAAYARSHNLQPLEVTARQRVCTKTQEALRDINGVVAAGRPIFGTSALASGVSIDTRVDVCVVADTTSHLPIASVAQMLGRCRNTADGGRYLARRNDKANPKIDFSDEAILRDVRATVEQCNRTARDSDLGANDEEPEADAADGLMTRYFIAYARVDRRTRANRLDTMDRLLASLGYNLCGRLGAEFEEAYGPAQRDERKEALLVAKRVLADESEARRKKVDAARPNMEIETAYKALNGLAIPEQAELEATRSILVHQYGEAEITPEVWAFAEGGGAKRLLGFSRACSRLGVIPVDEDGEGYIPRELEPFMGRANAVFNAALLERDHNGPGHVTQYEAQATADRLSLSLLAAVLGGEDRARKLLTHGTSVITGAGALAATQQWLMAQDAGELRHLFPKGLGKAGGPLTGKETSKSLRKKIAAVVRRFGGTHERFGKNGSAKYRISFAETHSYAAPELGRLARKLQKLRANLSRRNGTDIDWEGLLTDRKEIA